MKTIFTAFLTLLIIAFSLNANAQTYYQVTNFNGTQTYGGVGVTVTSSGSVQTGGGQCFTNPVPYWAGASGVGQYTFNFSQQVGTVRLTVEGLDPTEFVQVYINGQLVCINPCNVVCSYGILCGPFGGVLGSSGNCVFNASPLGYGGGQMIFPAGNITSFEVWCNGVAAGTDFYVEFSPTVNYNQCASCFNVSSNSPLCSGGTLNLHAFAPNATNYAWTGPNGYVSTGSDPTITNAGIAYAGTYTVIATGPGLIDTGYTTVVINPTPVITLTSTNPVTCGGLNGTIVLGGLIHDTTYTVHYTNANGAQTATLMGDVTGNVTLNGLPAGTYSNIYVVATFTGCVSNIVGPVTLTDPPKPSTPIVTSNSPVCVGQTLNFTATSSVADAYVWHGPSAYISNLQNPSITNVQYVNAGTYSVYAENTTTQCYSDTAHTIVAVNAPASAAFSYNISLGCVQDTVVFTDNSTNAATYSWDFGDGNIETSVNPTHYYTSQGIFTVTETVTSSLGCASTATQIVTLLHPTQAVIGINPDTACVGQQVNFTGSNSLGSGLFYAWNFSDNSAMEQTGDPAHAFTNAGVYNVNLVVTNYMGCVSSANRNVYIGAVKAVPGFHDTTVCLVDSMAMRAMVTTPTPQLFTGYTYLWSPADGLGDANVSSPNFMGTGVYKYTLIVTGLPFGCTSQDTVDVFSYPPLKLSNVTTDQTVPYGTSVQLNANGADYYFWTPDNGTLDNPNINYPLATPTESTSYVVHGMTTYGCRDSATVNLNIDFTMNQFIPSAFSPNGDGRNDVFRILNAKYQKLLDFRVYNRWGQLLFQTTDISKGWDGTYKGVPQDLGVYNYVIILAKPEGTEKTYSGTVTLVK